MSCAEQLLVDIKSFLETFKVPVTKSIQARKHLLKKSLEFFVKDEKLYYQNNPHLPQLVVTDPRKQIAILTQAHGNLDHKGEQAIFELIKIQFYWPHM